MKYTNSVLCWDDLADFYHKKTGNHARIQPMKSIYNWAIKQKEIKVNKDTTLSIK